MRSLRVPRRCPAAAGDDGGPAPDPPALAIQRDIDDRWGQSRTLTNLARLYENTGQLSATREYLRQAEEIDAETDQL